VKSLLTFLSLVLFATAPLAAGRSWSLNDIYGESFSAPKSLKSKPTLLLFWATWCKPCKAELDAMKDTFNGLAERGLNVVMISEDNQKSMSRVKPYIESKGYTWKALLDPDGEVLKLFGGTSIPYTVLLDKDGSPAFEHRGELKDPQPLLTKIDSMLESESE
jgi:cytochrome c biogenesis protein CcmG/thiol:disulfide interchange protein DsbE